MKLFVLIRATQIYSKVCSIAVQPTKMSLLKCCWLVRSAWDRDHQRHRRWCKLFLLLLKQCRLLGEASICGSPGMDFRSVEYLKQYRQRKPGRLLIRSG